MFYKILKIVTILLSSSAAESLLSPQGFSSFHPYHPGPSAFQHANEEHKVNNPRSIQYGPLKKQSGIHLENGWFSKMSAHSSRDLSDQPYTIPVEVNAKKDNRKLIELTEIKQSAVRARSKNSHLEYIPGHNIEVLRSLNRNTGHNAIYKSHDGHSTPEKINKVWSEMQTYMIEFANGFDRFTEQVASAKIILGNEPKSVPGWDHGCNLCGGERDQIFLSRKDLPLNHFKQYIIYPPSIRDAAEVVNDHKLKPIKESSVTTNTSTTTTSVPHQTASNNFPFHNVMKQLPPLAQKSPYTKMHALLLNVARAYGLTPFSQKSSVHSDVNPVVIANIPSNMPNLVQGPGVIHVEGPSEHKTYSHPLHSNLNIAFHS